MGGLLPVLTLVTTCACLGLTLWFAIYLLSRSRANPLAFRAVVALMALAFYYIYVLNALVTGEAEKSPVRLFATTVALIACHDLTIYLLDPEQRRKRYPMARGIVLFALIAIVLIFTAPPAPVCDPTTICPSPLNAANLVVQIFNVFVFCSILVNLWLIRKTEGKLQNLVFFLAVLLGISSGAISVLSTVLNVPMPRLLPNLLILAAVTLLAISVVRNRTFVTHRTSTYDLPVTLLTILVITAVYILVGRQLQLSGTDLILLTVLAVFTHSVYDFVRDYMEQILHRQERQMRRELDTLSREVNSSEELQCYLSRGLAILCKNLNASRGFIATRQDSQYAVVASFHSLPVGMPFPSKEVILECFAQPASTLFPQISWLAPGYAGSEQVVVVGIGTRQDNCPYDEEDLYWLEEIAQEIGQVAQLSLQGMPLAAQEARAERFVPETEINQLIDHGALLSALAYKPDLELLAWVEDAYQHLNDYDALGKSPLVELLGIHNPDHLENGKLVHERLVQILDKLRPSGPLPPEPLPREWHAYTILYDSYVNECQSRDIMGKLYIGEGTYYRLRRQALRGITRAMVEMGPVA